MKYPIGTKLIFHNANTKEDYKAEVVAPNDPRLKGKLSFPDDVCLYFEELDWSNTYDEDVVDFACKKVE
jgi:hypothetical protein